MRNESVRVERKRFGFSPEVFTWHGRRYDVRRVERCWTESRGSGWRRVERRYFRVHCDRGTFQLCHDLVANTWRVC
ncbi:MAG TPA: hypothetical protein PLJ35_13970 [Anaerolineae bacterium]|nr:hypothetical protein [Anaerolineae bacterium]HOQ99922.1 hypothetical protein [Anaerolineae bacterium]HPL29814.1 hypothetical protein [Anaerolineae bacterium]